ncbi:MAG: class I SAM-dependent methyltransferase [Deltaproteobacteria bacterium]
MRLVPDLGLVADEFDWVPSPTFVLRRAAVLKRLSSWAPGRVLEVGCGSGALLYELALRGFVGVGVEASPAARILAEKLLAEQKGVRISEALPEDSATFDYLLSFEVLEHIEFDLAALSAWVERLRPGGQCLISVPAHSAKWNLTDTLAGHFRRYDRIDARRLVEQAGLSIRSIETYGFPATWLIERVRLVTRWAQLLHRGIDPTTIARGDAVRTQQSGIARDMETKLFPIYGSRLGQRCWRWAARAQEQFAGTDWGISYLIAAVKEERLS